MRRNQVVPTLVPIFAMVFLLARDCAAQQGIPDSEKRLFDAANRERAERKLPVLKWDEGLARAAHRHAELMAEHDQLEHQIAGEADLATRAHEAGARFSHITENIAMGASAEKFHEGWMNSPGHRANILDNHADSIGIAVVEGEVDLYAVEDFAHAVAPLSIDEQEKRVGEVLAARGVRLISIGSNARKSCELDRGYVGTSNPKYVTHYQTPNVAELPGSVENELQSRHYKSAAVGACPQKEASGGFTRFRIVVLLY